jgi:hypothetical protein
MTGNRFDVDRSDFFQIHTYIQYHLNVKTGGLLYPISVTPNYENYQSPNLFNEFGTNTKFTIDGIEMQEMNEQENPRQKEMEFVKRIISHIDSSGQ